MSINKGIDKEAIWYIYTMEYCSAIKKNKMVPYAATWIHLEIVIPSEVRQKDKHHMILLQCGIFKKEHRWIYLQNRNRVADVENKLTVTRG